MSVKTEKSGSDAASTQASALLFFFLRTGFVALTAILAGLSRQWIFTFALTVATDFSDEDSIQRTPKPSPWEYCFKTTKN